MKIEWIEIKQFRSVGEKVIYLEFTYPDGRRNPSVLVGENNAGKSNILSAIQFMFAVIARQGQEEDFDWHLADRGNDIKIKAQIALDDETVNEMIRIFELYIDHSIEQDMMDHLKNELTDKLLVQILIQEDRKSNDRACLKWGPLCFNLSGTTGLDDSWRGLSGYATRDTKEIFQAYFKMVEDPHNKDPRKFEAALKQTLKSQKDFLDIPWLPKRLGELLASHFVTFSKIRNLPKGEHHPKIDSEDGSDLDTVLVNLMMSPDQEDKRRYGEIEHLFNRIFPFFRISLCQDRETQKPQLRISREDGKEFPIQFMGTGTLEVLYFLTKLALAEDKLVLIEDPELHLHPQAQRVVKSFLAERSKRNQIILATHSGIFIDLENLQNNFVVQVRNGMTEVFFIKESLSQTDKIILSSLLDTEKGSIFFSRLAVFVDGKTELGALPILAELKNVDFNRKSIFLFSLEGKKNLEKAIRIANGFNIPWISVCDYDAGMEITDSIESTRVPVLFKQLYNLGKLSPENLNFLEKNQDKIVKKGQREFFSEELFQEMKKILRDNRCFLLSSNFEGILKKEGCKKILQEAKRVVGGSKPRQGKYAARKIVQEKKILAEFSEIFEYIENRY
ncbi:MAG: AAA family ATPase [Theionarchaea archaeon]|nr:AAA family ATPase [Theionarchaea archaeon]